MKVDLDVTLPSGWLDISKENPEGPPTFVRSAENAAGVLQVSIQSIYESGPEPNPTYGDLVRLSEHVANTQQATITKRYWGDCELGTFGCVIANTVELPSIQIWTLSNGRDFVLATFLCAEVPDAEEMFQAENIVKTLKLQSTS